MRVYKVPEEEQAKVLAFIGSLDIRAIATKVMYKLFAMLEMTFDFKLSKDDEEGKQDEKTVIEHHTYSMYGNVHYTIERICGHRIWHMDRRRTGNI